MRHKIVIKNNFRIGLLITININDLEVANLRPNLEYGNYTIIDVSHSDGPASSRKWQKSSKE